jgi:dTDP-4-dehydrorhamnose reductase
VYKILVTGSKGQLGNEIRLLTETSSHTFTLIDKEELDLSNAEDIDQYFKKFKFDCVVNCAAYTAVDKAETESDLAYSVNTLAVEMLAKICVAKGIRLIHISTDYVFDGTGNAPLTETDNTNPISVYGKSKFEAEQIVLSMLPNAYIIRTAWVYSVFGKNFVKTIAALAREKEFLNVVYDQVGCLTHAGDLAKIILHIIDNISENRDDIPGLYHYSSEGVTSWYDVARFITDHYRLSCRIVPILSSQYQTAAVRPKFTVLDKSKIKNLLRVDVPYWQESLKKTLQLLPC